MKQNPKGDLPISNSSLTREQITVLNRLAESNFCGGDAHVSASLKQVLKPQAYSYQLQSERCKIQTRGNIVHCRAKNGGGK